nr:NADH dehydrogenase subunit 4 [Pennella sp. (in: crustaceans)]
MFSFLLPLIVSWPNSPSTMNRPYLKSVFSLKYMNLASLFILLCKSPLYSLPQLFSSVDITIDPFSWSMIMLSLLLSTLTTYFSPAINWKNYHQMPMLCFLLCLICIVTFCSKSMMMFFIFFELSLIPIFLVILGWGYQPERVGASKMMLFYTLFGSMPFLAILNILTNSSMNCFIMNSINQSFNYSLTCFLMMTLLLLLKLPLFSLHLWLPAAHVEAPMQGSILLAGILLKLGGFGLWRICSMITMSSKLMSYNIMPLTVFGLFASVLVILSQTDTKVIIAYSSVAHMTIAFLGIMIQSLYSMVGSFIMFVGHTIISANLFLLMAILFHSTNTRNILLNKGFISIQPLVMLLLGISCIFNAGGPFTLSLMSEISLIITSYNSISFSLLPIFFFLMGGMAYNMIVYSKISHSNFNKDCLVVSSKLLMAASTLYVCLMILSTLMMFFYFL